MYIEFNLPPAPETGIAVSAYWSRQLFVGTPSTNYQVNALAGTYMRLTEAAAIEYNFGAAALQDFWSEHRTVLLSSMHRAISHFETCIADVHRAIDTFRRLRNHKERDALSVYLASCKPAFLSDSVTSSFREARDAIHHLSEKVVNGQLSEGQPIALKPDGPEVPHSTESGQIIKTFDRLVIGPHVITFADLVATLTELSSAAAYIAEYPLPASSGNIAA